MATHCSMLAWRIPWTEEPRGLQSMGSAAFAMRRKTLANNLKASFGLDNDGAKAVLAAAGVDEKVRGEALSLKELCRVADALCSR